MTLGLNLISPIVTGSSSPPDNQSNEAGNQNTGETSGTDGATTTESSSGASQTSEAKQTQTVQPVETDVAVAKTAKTDVTSAADAVELSDTMARKFAIKARAESIVTALIEAISAPIEASELAALDPQEAAAKTSEAPQSANRPQDDRFESALRADS